MCRSCVLLLFGILLTLLFSSCEEKVKPSIASSRFSGDTPTQESWNASITFTDSGRITAILHAGHIGMFSDRKITRLDSNLTVDFFDEHERHTSVLTARRGQVNDLTHDFEAHEHVVVVSDSGTTLRTEDLFWDNGRQKVHTPSFVDILSPTEHLQGHGFESDRGLKRYTVFRVTGEAKSE